jgi:hypothetical protein
MIDQDFQDGPNQGDCEECAEHDEFRRQHGSSVAQRGRLASEARKRCDRQLPHKSMKKLGSYSAQSSEWSLARTFSPAIIAVARLRKKQ